MRGIAKVLRQCESWMPCFSIGLRGAAGSPVSLESLCHVGSDHLCLWVAHSLPASALDMMTGNCGQRYQGHFSVSSSMCLGVAPNLGEIPDVEIYHSVTSVQFPKLRLTSLIPLVLGISNNISFYTSNSCAVHV